MEKFLTENPALKRLLLTATGVAFVGLNKKFGLNLGAEELAMIVGLIISAVAGSNWKAAKVAATEERAAATVAEVVEEKTEEIDYEAMSKKELQGFASSKELPEKDWEKLSKTALITYLESKVK